ncbi:D-alanyl-D-alanine carboxypeptidase family protein [Oceanobacillus sp. CAU 1775]
MKYLLTIVLVIFASFFVIKTGHAQVNVSAEHAVLMDLDTGEILFEKAANEKSMIASITKIMTALLAIESGKMDEETTISRNAIYTEGSSIYLEQGEKVLIKDLVYGTMLRSGNDAAVAIAEHIGGSEEGFIFLMNEKANWLGMNNTYFENPHGLDAESHYSSAMDMAILTREAMLNDEFQEVSRTKIYKSNNRTYSWQNKHKLVTGYYQYATGGKTGYTKRTGRTLITTAEKNGNRLVSVTLNAPDDWNDHINLLEWGFQQLEESGQVPHGELEEDVLNTVRPNAKSYFLNILSRMAGIQQW